MNKKGQPSGASAATLVVAIALIIIIYLLFIPPSAREELLGPPTSTTQNATTPLSTILLKESPGTLDVVKETQKTHYIPSIRLFSKTESVPLKTFSPFYVSNSFFDKNEKLLGLELKDLENTNNVIMTFNVGAAKGRLIIELNDNIVFDGKITKSYVEPIELPKSMLKEQNTLKFYTEQVGWRFWKKFEYEINDFKIVGDITDISKQNSKTVFIVPDSELTNIKTSNIRFLPECDESEAGTLTIKINDKEIYSAIPDCKSPSVIEFSPSIFKKDENTIEFSAEKGTYLIDQIVIRNELKQAVNPVYFFTLSTDQLDSINKMRYDAELYLEFVDSTTNKQATFIINGIQTQLEQKERIYSKIINQYLRLGNNGIEIVPRSKLDILTLEVRLI